MVYEDWTDGWVEEDPTGAGAGAGHIQWTANHIDFASYRNEDAWFYKDRGIGHFDDFEHLYDAKVDSLTAGKWCTVWALTNDVGHDLTWLLANNKTVIQMFFYTDDLYIREYYNGNQYTAGPFFHNTTNWLYFRVKKEGTAFTLRIWSNGTDRDNNDIGAASYKGQLSLTLQADHSFRYIFSAITLNTGDAYNVNGDIENLDLQEPQNPTVTTGDATDITDSTATGHGNIIDTGADPTCDERGCEWGLVSGGPYPNSVTESGSFGVGAFTSNLTGLPCNTVIYYRAKAHNSIGWGYGTEVSFLTFWCACPPYTPCVNLGIRLNWRDNADYEDNYYVERDDGGWHLIATLPADTTTYLDTTAKCGIAYLYRVRAGNVTGYSNYVTLSSSIICPCLSPHSVVPLMRVLDII